MVVALFWCLNAQASVINSASCSQTDVQKAINSAQVGDTIVVPAGTCTYNTVVASTPSLNINKAVTVQGQTTCTGRASTLSCTDRTIISDGTGTKEGEIPVDISASGARLSGFSFVDTRTVSDAKSALQTEAGTTGWRIDHCHFHPTNTNHTRAIIAMGYGLIDHDLFQDALDGVAAMGDHSGDVTPGDVSWSQPMSLGTANAIYMEDNEFNYTHVLDGAYDAYSGARLVFRYNDVKGTNFGGHGLDSGGLRSTMQEEIYGNTISNSGATIYVPAETRGGEEIMFNNNVSSIGGSYTDFYWIKNYRSDPGCATSGECGSWGTCDGTNALDQNTPGYHGWPCKDQVGRGTNEASYPAYLWGNIFKGAAPTLANFYICGFQDCTQAQTYHILWNRDVFNEIANFNGAAGVGSGLLSARPHTCTPKVAYWATDTNTLYQCSSTNTWSVYYKPYTYPHPLQAGASSGSAPPNPPSGLVTVVK